jgi:hypothetical protein
LFVQNRQPFFRLMHFQFWLGRRPFQLGHYPTATAT